MESIMTKMLKKIEKGARFSIDFKERSLKVNGKYIIEKGKYEGALIDDEYESFEQAIPVLEEMYRTYRNSVPSRTSERGDRTYFEALPYEKLSNDDVTFGPQRDPAQFLLEFTVLSLIILGKFNNAFDGWFWQSSVEKDFVILKEWVK